MSKKQPAAQPVVAKVTYVALSDSWGGKKAYFRYDLSNDVHIYVPVDKDPLVLSVGDTLTFAKD